jgi:AmmeMemoRadiSam system protein A
VSAEDQWRLLQLVEETIRACVHRRQPPVDPCDPVFAEPQPMFITVRVRGELRGCIGRLDPTRNSAVTAIETAAAALRDGRFADRRVTVDELANLTVELMLLGPRQRIDGPGDIEIGRHGVVLELDDRTAVFLPQVAVEQGWNAVDLLGNLCTKKLKLPAESWLLPSAKLWVMEGQKLAT